MPQSRLLQLYLGKTLADLKSQYEVNVKGKKPKLLCHTAEKLFKKANLELERGDEERSYIDFMKYLSVVSYIQTSDEFKKDVNYFKNMLGPEKIGKALNNAERLSESLEKRYKLMAEIDASNLEQERKEAEEAEKKVLSRATEVKYPQTIPDNVADVSATSLSSRRLYQLISEKKIKILIIDSRPAACYANSHMIFDNSISVPNEVVKAGMSASALEKLLPIESKELFGQRRLVDLIVLLDWTSTEKSLTPGSILYTIKTILLKWDPGIIYNTPPLILEGGYEDWLITYPMYTTNPKAHPPPVDNDLDDLLDNIEYPSWNESPPEKPPHDRTIQPASIKVVESVSRSADGLPVGQLKETRPGSRSENDVKPGVDRGSKAAAIQTYEERSRAINQLLKARETVANSSLEIEKDMLSAEKEWELLRLQKEKEAEEGMRQELQEREELLLKNIFKLEESQRNQEAENQSLRLQLDEYKKRDAEESVKVADKHRKDREVEIKERIDKKEEEIKKIAKEREEISKERIRQVDEDRRKRKIEAERKEKQRLEQLEHGKPAKDAGTYTTQLKSDSSSNSSIMKRSHSSPNIAQMMDDIQLEEKHKAPQFDRTIKPLQKPLPYELNAARQRNFNGVLGRVGRGLTGLKNLGNTCYLNSIVQCISNTLPIVTYFCEGNYREDVNHANKTHGEVVEEVAAVVRALWNGQYKFISCGDLKSIVGLHKEEFRGNQQQDSHEFLFFLINWLHDDLNKKSSRKIIKDAKENIPEADKQWSEFKQTNESLILTLFYGQQKSTVRCLTCHKESSTYEPFNHLSLPLPNTSSRCSLNECLQLYLSGDRISGWNCPSCKAARDATKKFDICKLPPVLVIHLKRFYHDGWSRKKQTFVDFPLQNLDMRDWTLDPNQRYRTYDLYGVSNHYGTMEGGHYTSYCKNNTYGKWYKFDDHEVNELSPSNVKTAAAYILFYSSSKL